MKQSAIIRLGGLRAVAMFVMNIAGALIAILLLPAVLLYPSASGHRPDVVVRDEAGIYHEQTLRRGLEAQHYDREVRIVVLSVPGPVSATLTRRPSSTLATVRRAPPGSREPESIVR